MNTPRFTSRWLFLFTAALILVARVCAQVPSGGITGIVSNAGTGDLLEGVRVAMPSWDSPRSPTPPGGIVSARFPPEAMR